MRCSKCVMPSSRPDHVFINGVCPACINAKKKVDIDWDERKKELTQLLDRHHGDVIVPSSGGKDSTYQAITLKEMGANVTAVTARTCHLTPIGRFNIDNLAKHVRTIEIVPNMTVRAKLNRIGLEMVGDISWPEHASIFTTPFRVARDLDASLIMYGENPQNQYGGPVGSDQTRYMTKRWVNEFGGFLGLRPYDFIGMEGITQRDMDDYDLPADIGMGGAEAHFLGQYIPWDSSKNAEIAKSYGMKQKLPCEANWWDAENLDNAQTSQHDFFCWLKYGYGRGCSQISVDIRKGVITRAEALKWVEQHDGIFPVWYADVGFDKILDRIDMHYDEFWKIARQFTNFDIHKSAEGLPRGIFTC